MNAPFDRSQLASVAYWRESDERRAQHFYIGFCLLMSSIQDALLGQRELEGRNLNWSTTCSYYSMVHVGRILFFLPFGDFPTQHKRLHLLLNPEDTPPRSEPRGRNQFPFNWLQDFAHTRAPTESGTPQNRSQEHGTTEAAASWRSAIIRYLDPLPEAAGRVVKFDGFISRGAALRNDSNYEALLIAHEHQHDDMTGAFEALAQSMAVAADYGVCLAIDAFRGFLEHDADLPIERDEYRAFLCTYARDRIRQPLIRKLVTAQHSDALPNKLDEYLKRLCPRPVHGNFNRLENYVSMDHFDGKTGRMRRFREKIDALSASVM